MDTALIKGVLGTVATLTLSQVNTLISITVGVLTAIYMGCKIYDWATSKRQTD